MPPKRIASSDGPQSTNKRRKPGNPARKTSALPNEEAEPSNASDAEPTQHDQRSASATPPPTLQDNTLDSGVGYVDGGYYADDPINYINAAIQYTRTENAAGRTPRQHRRFTMLLIPRSPGLQLLRLAHREGLADQIYTTDDREVYELGIPHYGHEGPGEIGPHWWANLGRSAIRAGPWADEDEVRQQRSILRGVRVSKQTAAKKRRTDTGDSRSKRQTEIHDKLAEGLRRQEADKRSSESDNGDGRPISRGGRADRATTPRGQPPTETDSSTSSFEPEAPVETEDSGDQGHTITAIPEPSGRDLDSDDPDGLDSHPSNPSSNNSDSDHTPVSELDNSDSKNPDSDNGESSPQPNPEDDNDDEPPFSEDSQSDVYVPDDNSSTVVNNQARSGWGSRPDLTCYFT